MSQTGTPSDLRISLHVRDSPGRITTHWMTHCQTGPDTDSVRSSEPTERHAMSNRQDEDEADRQWLRLPEAERKRRMAEALRLTAEEAEREAVTAAREGLTVISQPAPPDSELMPKTPANTYRIGTVVEDRHGVRWEVTTGGQRDEYLTWKRLGRAPDLGAGGRPTYTL